MLRRTGITLLLLFLCSTAFAQEEYCKLSHDALEAAESIRGLSVVREVPCVVQQREQVRSYILSTMNEKVPDSKLLLEEKVYKEVGFLPRSFSYKDGLVELYLSQLGGYYDPDKKRFVMAGWIPPALQTTIAVHELTHALQDQHFGLADYLQQDKYSTDQLLARSALVEGDASAVMFDYTRKLVGQPPLARSDSVDSLLLQNIIGASFLKDVDQVPKSLLNLLLFPYTSGLRFVHFVLLHDGGYQAIDKIFERPPESTEQILHPEKRLKRDGTDSRVVTTEELRSDLRALGAQGTLEKPEFEDTLGEFFISVTIAQCLADTRDAARASAGWGGDRIALFQKASSSSELLVWKTLWDSVKDRDEFVEIYGRCLEKLAESDGAALSRLQKLGETDAIVVWEISGGPE